MSDWQPIETAPKDGTEFFATTAKKTKYRYGDDYPNTSVCSYSDDGLLSCQCDMSGWYHLEPTHWAPIPRPPANTQDVQT